MIDFFGQPAAGEKRPFSRATRTGGLVFVSGHSAPHDPARGIERGDTAEEQVRNALNFIADILCEAGSSLDRVVQVSMLITDPADYDACNREYVKHFPGGLPARHTARFGVPTEAKVAFSCIALAGEWRGTLDGNNLAGLSSAVVTRRGISYVPQGRGLFAGMTVAENMELGRLKRRNGQGMHWEEDKIFTFFPRIKERWKSPADYLSGGEQQMVAVARALSGDTRILLLDEPFEGLAPAIVEELFEAFDKLRQEVSILIVDHHLDLALALSDRTVALERGQVQYTGPSKELSQDIELRRKVLWL